MSRIRCGHCHVEVARGTAASVLEAHARGCHPTSLPVERRVLGDRKGAPALMHGELLDGGSSAFPLARRGQSGPPIGDAVPADRVPRRAIP